MNYKKVQKKYRDWFKNRGILFYDSGKRHLRGGTVIPGKPYVKEKK